MICSKFVSAVCVLIQANQSLPSRAWIGGMSQDITYTEGPWVCNKCRKVGHNDRNCVKKASNSGGKEEGQRKLEVVNGSQNTRRLGVDERGWTQIQTKRRGRKSSTSVGPGSRWTPKKKGEEDKQKVAVRQEQRIEGNQNSKVEGGAHKSPIQSKKKIPLSDENQFVVLQTLQCADSISISPHPSPKRGDVKSQDCTLLQPPSFHNPIIRDILVSQNQTLPCPSHLTTTQKNNKENSPILISPPSSNNPNHHGSAGGDGPIRIYLPNPSSITTLTSTPTTGSSGILPQPHCLLSTNPTTHPRTEPGVCGLLPSGLPGGPDGILHRVNPKGSEGVDNQPISQAGGSKASHDVSQLRIQTSPYATASRCNSPTSIDENISHVVLQQRGRSRTRREKPHDDSRTMDRSSPSVPFDPNGSLDETSAGNTSGDEQYRRDTMYTSPPPHETIGDHSLLGRGKRQKKPARGRSSVLATPKNVDMSGNRDRNRSVGGRKRGDSQDASRQTTTLYKGMNMLFWNVRGIARPSFKPNFRLLVQQHHPSLVILVETWVGREKTAEIIRDCGFDSWYLVDPVGFVGGILLLWKSHVMDFQVVGHGAQGVYGVTEAVAHEIPRDSD
ncbi:uncharacterized protein LOC104887955 [Beta vulgaris subsp. vulgaris]|uniref:uncharacterized protein LOC104887955 n=1 Tax=Beta vulgaris subsp. vulgaris TaxID=3555 RepID=UPI0025494516|nr:uncharacterized protein LOC104887955 [Beta vulgaris subsp. vulgaris]